MLLLTILLKLIRLTILLGRVCDKDPFLVPTIGTILNFFFLEVKILNLIYRFFQSGFLDFF